MQQRSHIRVQRAIIGAWLSRHVSNRPWWTVPIRANHRARILRAPGARIIINGRLLMDDMYTAVGRVSRGLGASIELGRDAALLINGNVHLGDGTRLLVGPGATMTLNDRCALDGDQRFIAASSVTIGARCSIAWDVLIMDSHFHAIDGLRAEAKQIIVGEHVWIGAGAKILRGVTVGDGAVIAAGAVVSSDVPPRSVVAGVPARVIREDVNWD